MILGRPLIEAKKLVKVNEVLNNRDSPLMWFPCHSYLLYINPCKQSFFFKKSKQDLIQYMVWWSDNLIFSFDE